jgi:hypothetical protein
MVVVEEVEVEISLPSIPASNKTFCSSKQTYLLLLQVEEVEIIVLQANLVHHLHLLLLQVEMLENLMVLVVNINRQQHLLHQVFQWVVMIILLIQVL